MKRCLIIFSTTTLLLSGCWDQRLIKDMRLVYASAFDLTDEGKVYVTSVIRGFVAGESGGGTLLNEVISAEGYNLRNSRMNMDRKIAGTFNASKNRVFLLSDEIGKKGIYPFLDIFYREPTSSLNSKLAITKGSAGMFIEMQHKQNTLIGEYFEELIKSSERNTIVPKIDVQSVCPLFFDPGKDPVLPYLRLNKEKQEAEVIGVALFKDDKMTGSLNVKDSTMLLVLLNKTNYVTRMVRKVHDNKEEELENYGTIHVLKSKSKFEVIPNGSDSVKVKINIDMDVNMVEYPPDHLVTQKLVEQLNKRFSKIFTKDIYRVVSKLQEANSDVLGIGREIIAFHPEIWKEMKWDEAYPQIPFEVHVNVQIAEHGIIN